MCGRDNDPFVTYLKALGYNTVRLPRASLRPLQVLAQQGKELTPLGELAEVFSSTGKLPDISADVRAADIAGKRTGEISIGVGLSLLGNILTAFGGSKVGLDVAYKNARTAIFEFQDVLVDSVSVAKLDQFLSTADVNFNGPTVAQLLDADSILVMTSCIKSTKFTLDVGSSGGVDIGLSIPVIQQAVGASVKVSGDAASTTKLTYAGPLPLVFGFQAVRLYYDHGAYTALKPEQGAILQALHNAPQDGADRWVVSGNFASVR